MKKIYEHANQKQFTIYKVTNLLNNEVYIGSTTKSLKKRRKQHLRRSLEKDYSKFSAALGAYCTELFSWKEIDFATNLNELALKEKMYIKKFGAIENGYNKNSGGGFKKKVYQYCTKTGSQIASYNSLEEACKAVNTIKSNISAACLGVAKTAKGSAWSYQDLDAYKVKDKRLKPVKQLSNNGLVINEFESIAKASRVTKINKNSIAKVIRGERKSAGGYLWAQ